jgi:hypothetical protein
MIAAIKLDISCLFENHGNQRTNLISAIAALANRRENRPGA